MQKGLIIITFLLLLSDIAIAQNSSLLTKIGDLNYCLDSSEFRIDRFYYGQPKNEISDLLGSPDSTWINEGPSETYFYKDIRIEFNGKGKSYYLATKNEAYKTPSGIHVGQSRNKIFRILGINPAELPTIKYEIEFVNCQNEVYFILIFDKSLILQGLEIGVDLP
jgi:hypothetical protein